MVLAMDTPPPIPPRGTRPAGSAWNVPANTDTAIKAGALFAPGQWPTPELSSIPLGRYSICSTQPYTSHTIQNALDALGASSTLYLPRSSVWSVDHPIQLHEHQELATWGYPNDEKEMAHLEAEKDCHPHIVNARAKSGAKLRNIFVDGGRERHGHDPKCGVMLQFGHQATDQAIDRCIIRHPRHWSCIQAFEGSQNVRITNNRVGPAGTGADKDQGKWADGISFAGANGLVAGNEILDATDGAIVVFGAPGSLITSNTIICRDRLALGAINMVDWAPHDGNYTQTRVVHNSIITQGPAGYIKTGIGQGPSVWWASNPPEKLNTGAIVQNNLIDSQDIGFGHGSVGYGFAVASDVRNWICVGNVSSSTVRYEGDISKSLPVPNVAPGPFVHDVPHMVCRFSEAAMITQNRDSHQGTSVVLQPEFSHGRGRIRHLISIAPGASRILSYQPGQFHLGKGRQIVLESAILSNEQDGIVRIRERQGNRIGAILWEGGFGRERNPSGQYLTYSTGGKLCVLSGGSSAQICVDFIPHMPLHAAPGGEADEAPTFVFSDSNPHLSVTTPASSILFSSSYIYPPNRAFPGCQVVARSYLYGNSQRTLLYTLSPYCQFVVLRGKMPHALVPSLPLVWPSPEREAHWEWEIVWSTPNPRTKEKRTDAMMFFQGDGNLVIRSQNTVPWASGSHDRHPPATHIRFGIGSVEEPWVEIVDDSGGRVWAST
ncbi:hypothetical protein K439DRAFT_1390599 [Ramaria rubella]|nr:hypothetical protein K439DRAFT_1390599 [Ramaria rubella]